MPSEILQNITPYCVISLAYFFCYIYFYWVDLSYSRNLSVNTICTKLSCSKHMSLESTVLNCWADAILRIPYPSTRHFQLFLFENVHQVILESFSLAPVWYATCAHDLCELFWCSTQDWRYWRQDLGRVFMSWLG